MVPIARKEWQCTHPAQFSVPEIHLKRPLGAYWLLSADARISHKVLCRARAASRKRRLPMDTQTVIATCEVLLVVIGIIGLVLVRRE